MVVVAEHRLMFTENPPQQHERPHRSALMTDPFQNSLSDSSPTISASPVSLAPHIQAAQNIMDILFGPPAIRAFSVRYPDGSLESSGAPRPLFTLALKRAGSLSRMFWPPQSATWARRTCVTTTTSRAI